MKKIKKKCEFCGNEYSYSLTSKNKFEYPKTHYIRYIVFENGYTVNAAIINSAFRCTVHLHGEIKETEKEAMESTLEIIECHKNEMEKEKKSKTQYYYYLEQAGKELEENIKIQNRIDRREKHGN